MKESGKTTTWKAWEYTNGTTVESTWATIKMTKSMDLESMFGQITESMKATGSKASNTGLEHIMSPKKTKSSTDFGKTASVSSGLTTKTSLLSIVASLTIHLTLDSRAVSSLSAKQKPSTDQQGSTKG